MGSFSELSPSGGTGGDKGGGRYLDRSMKSGHTGLEDGDILRGGDDPGAQLPSCSLSIPLWLLTFRDP